MLPCLAALFLALASTGDSGCTDSRLVSVGYRCIDVPCAYEVVVTLSGADTSAGYIEPPEHNWRINWLNGMWEDQFRPSDTRRIIWKRDEVVGQRRMALGLIESEGVRYFVLTEPLLQLLIPESAPSGLEMLKAVGARLRNRNEYQSCESPRRADK